MAKKTDSKPEVGVDDAEVRRLLEEVKAEPVPPRITELAEMLERVLADKSPKPQR